MHFYSSLAQCDETFAGFLRQLACSHANETETKDQSARLGYFINLHLLPSGTAFSDDFLMAEDHNFYYESILLCKQRFLVIKFSLKCH